MSVVKNWNISSWNRFICGFYNIIIYYVKLCKITNYYNILMSLCRPCVTRDVNTVRELTSRKPRRLYQGPRKTESLSRLLPTAEHWRFLAVAPRQFHVRDVRCMRSWYQFPMFYVKLSMQPLVLVELTNRFCWIDYNGYS